MGYAGKEREKKGSNLRGGCTKLLLTTSIDWLVLTYYKLAGYLF